MLHGRGTVPVEDKLRWINEQFARKGLEVRLRREEVIAIILHAGPVYVIYNACAVMVTPELLRCCSVVRMQT